MEHADRPRTAIFGRCTIVPLRGFSERAEAHMPFPRGRVTAEQSSKARVGRAPACSISVSDNRVCIRIRWSIGFFVHRTRTGASGCLGRVAIGRLPLNTRPACSLGSSLASRIAKPRLYHKAWPCTREARPLTSPLEPVRCFPTGAGPPLYPRQTSLFCLFSAERLSESRHQHLRHIGRPMSEFSRQASSKSVVQ